MSSITFPRCPARTRVQASIAQMDMPAAVRTSQMIYTSRFHRTDKRTNGPGLRHHNTSNICLQSDHCAPGVVGFTQLAGILERQTILLGRIAIQSQTSTIAASAQSRDLEGAVRNGLPSVNSAAIAGITKNVNQSTFRHGFLQRQSVI
jgi:hypothetical protein